MATHDYVIDNQSAPAFRSDLNNVLQAIVSQNSSAAAPTTTYADMIWYDTAANQLKKRNEANSAWVTLGTIDEGLGTFTPTGLPPIASTLEAQAGTDDTKMMTPLKTAQAITALATIADGTLAPTKFISPSAGTVILRNCLPIGGLTATSTTTTATVIDVPYSFATALISSTVRVQFTCGFSGTGNFSVFKNGVAVLSRTTPGTDITTDIALVAGDTLAVRISGTGTSGGSTGQCSLSALTYRVNTRSVAFI